MTLPADDEFALLEDNATEVGLPWHARPAVARRAITLPDKRRVSAIVWGHGPPEVVLVHGGAQNAHTWDTVALAVGCPLVAVDLAGHGHSDWRDDHDYRPAHLSADLAAAIEALAPDASLVVGMSLGGLTSLALAAARPELVRRLMLIDITPGVNADKSHAIHEFVSGPERFAGFDEILDRTIRYNPGRRESSLRRGVIHNSHQLPDGSWTWRWDPVRRVGPSEPAGPASADRLADLGGLWDALGSLEMPLTLVRGAQSPVVDDADVAELRRRRPDAEVIVVEGAGHSIQGDQPLRLAELIAERLGRGVHGPFEAGIQGSA